MMNYRFFLAIFFLLSLLPAAAQAPAEADFVLTAEKCFVELPDSVFPLISKSGRLDMIDYFKAGSDKTTTNEFGGDSRILACSPQLVEIQATENARYQLFVLNPQSSRPVIALIETVALPMADSSIAFYDKHWRPIAGLMTEPTLADWLTPQGLKDKSVVTDAVPFITADYSFDPATATLTATRTIDSYFARGEGDKALALLKKQLTYKWTGRQFRLVK